MDLSRGAIIAAAVLALGACSAPDDGPAITAATTTQPSPTQSTAPSVFSTPSATGAPDTSASPSVTTDESSTVTSPAAGSEEAERWAALVPAFQEYWDVINETYAAGGAPEATARMKETMTGAQMDFWEKTFADFAERDRRYEGENVVTGANPTVVKIGPESGNAELEYCVDMSETSAFEANGDELSKDGDYQAGVAALVWVDGRWKVVGFTPESGVVPSC